MKWATRAGCHVDRAACAWLILRFIDDDAEFVFVDDPDEVPNDATAFDMPGVDLSHHGGDCSFETMLHHYELDDPILWDLAGTVLASVFVGRYADRVGRRRCYVTLYLLLAVIGLAFAFSDAVWLLILAALTGALSTEVVESGPFTSLEQAILADELSGTTRLR